MSSFRLIHLSDPHFGTAIPSQAEDLINKCRELQADFTVMSGDFSMRARRHELRLARAWLDRWPSPFLPIPGNHDVPLLNHLGHRFASPFRRYRHFIHHDLEPSTQLPIGSLLGLNSARAYGLHLNWSLGFLSPLQLQRIRTHFENTSGLRLLTFHHPLFRKGAQVKNRPLIAPTRLIEQCLSDSHIDLVMCGHFHQASAQVHALPNGRSLVLSQASTACSSRTKNEAAGFHFIELTNQSIQITPFTWQSDEFSPQIKKCFHKSAQGWQSVSLSSS